MSGQEGGPSNNANLGPSRGGRTQNTYSRGRGGSGGPSQRGGEGPGGRNGGRGGGRSGGQYSQVMGVQQQPRRPDAHQPQYFHMNNGGQRGQNQQFGPSGSMGVSLPPGLGGPGPMMQFGSIQPGEFLVQGQAPVNIAQAHYMNRSQHIPQQPSSKLPHQQHVGKGSQPVSQVPAAMVMNQTVQGGPPGLHTQVMMQQHQGQPGQQYLPAQPQYGPHQSMYAQQVPPGLMVPNAYQQQQALQAAHRPRVVPVTKRVLSLVNPETNKPVDIAPASAAPANGATVRSRSASSQEPKPAPGKPAADASKGPRATPPSPPAKLSAVPKPAADQDAGGKETEKRVAVVEESVKAVEAPPISAPEAKEASALNGPSSTDAAKAQEKAEEKESIVLEPPVANPQPAQREPAEVTNLDQAASVSSEAEDASTAPTATALPTPHAVEQTANDTVTVVPEACVKMVEEESEEKRAPEVGASISPSIAPPADLADDSPAAVLPEGNASPRQLELAGKDDGTGAAVAPESAPADAKDAEEAAPVVKADSKGAAREEESIVEEQTGLSEAAAAVEEEAVQERLEASQPVETSAEPEPLQDEDGKAPETAGDKAGLPATSSAKAKRKALLARANAEGAKGDILDAFVTPPPAQPEAPQEALSKTPRARPSAGPAAQHAGSDQQPKEEPDFDDWEAAAEGIATPSGAATAQKAAAASASVADAAGRRMYSRDWLLTFRDQCTSVPVGLEAGSDVMREGGQGPPSSLGRGPGGGFDQRPRGGPPPVGPPGIGMGSAPGLDDKHWKRGTMRGPDGMTPMGPPGMGGHGMMGPPGPPVGGRGGGPRATSGIDSAKWQRGLQPPPPLHGAQGGFGGPHRGYGGPAITLHKTDNKYQIGRLTSDDPEEEKRQKEFKSLLNKITPDNYQTIKEKILAVGIQSPITLTGLISQVFDKALGEPSFSEIYATLCYDMNHALPSFTGEDEDGVTQEITFRRLLLNKCQEEFEEGDVAMKAVEAREKAQREQVDGQGDAEEDDKEDGEITQEERQQRKREDREKAQLELKARRRALGNIQFIGQLYKQKMLTEKIMHSCITTLLGEVENPKAEDVECLCKLLTTIGALLDASQKGHPLMGAYFNRLERLASSPKLESRHKFMIQDVIELRKSGWVARRKVEGPKKIDEIHKDARMELQRQRMAPPLPDRGGHRRGMERPAVPQRPPERLRLDDRVDGPIRPMKREPSQEWLTGASLRPGGAAPRAQAVEPTVSLRPGGPAAAGAGAGARSSSTSSIRTPSPAREASPAPPAASASQQPDVADSVAEMSRDKVLQRSQTLAIEYLAHADMKELLISLEELRKAKADFTAVIEGFFNGTFAAKGVDRTLVVDLLVNASTAPENGVSPSVVEQGLKGIVDALDQTAVDVPFAPQLVGESIGALAAKGIVNLKAMAEHVLTAESPDAEPREDEEDTALVDGGAASVLITSALRRLGADGSPRLAAQTWQETGLSLLSFLPSYEREDDGALSALIQKQGLQGLYPLAAIQRYLPNALQQAVSAENIIAWMQENAADAMASDEFVQYVTAEVLKTKLGGGQGVDVDSAAIDAGSDHAKILQGVVGEAASKELQMAAIAGAADFFKESASQKGLLRRLLSELLALGVVSSSALLSWRYDTNDTEAVKDVSTWLDDLKEGEDADDGSP